MKRTYDTISQIKIIYNWDILQNCLFKTVKVVKNKNKTKPRNCHRSEGTEEK